VVGKAGDHRRVVLDYTVRRGHFFISP
jgi:hypothetical protein